MKQVQVTYSGDVIGAGFRLTANEIARDLNLVGWVRNLPDDRVELLVQGEEGAIKKLLDQLTGIFQNNIEESKITWQKPSSELSEFEIKYG